MFDLDAGPVTVTPPDAGKRFISCQIISEDQYTWPAIYDANPHEVTREQIGTRYVLLAFRILMDPNDPKDLAQSRALQDAIKIEQPGWNYMVRLYRPRAEILNETWKFPEAQPAP